MNEITSPSGQSMSLSPKTLDEAIRFAEMLSKAELVPKDFQNKPGNVLVAIQWGMELGLQPMQAMQNIAVINGRPSLWGDAVIGLCKSSPVCEYIVEEVTDAGAVCRVKRKGEPEQTRSFSREDAQKAGLLNKQGPWSQYPKRMLQMRARSWALRDVFPDVLRGMPVAEELMDVQEIDVTPKKPYEGATQSTQKELPAYTEQQMTENLPQWYAAIKAGKISAEKIINKVSSLYTLTADQKQRINNLEAIEPEQPPEALPPDEPNAGTEYGDDR